MPKKSLFDAQSCLSYFSQIVYSSVLLSTLTTHAREGYGTVEYWVSPLGA